MKSLEQILKVEEPELLILTSLLVDCGVRCAVDVERDIQRVYRRYVSEGKTFLYATLPVLSSYLENILEHRTVELVGFRTRRDSHIPVMLGGFFEQVMHSDGGLLQDPSVDAIYSIRQIARCFKKIEVPCTPEVVQEKN